MFKFMFMFHVSTLVSWFLRCALRRRVTLPACLGVGRSSTSFRTIVPPVWGTSSMTVVKRGVKFLWFQGESARRLARSTEAYGRALNARGVGCETVPRVTGIFEQARYEAMLAWWWIPVFHLKTCAERRPDSRHRSLHQRLAPARPNKQMLINRGVKFSWFQGGIVMVASLTMALWHRRELARLSLAFVEDNECGLVLSTGIACATAQCALWLLFTFALGDGPWRREPGFTAHQVVCFPIMIYLTYLGLSSFGANSDTPVSRVFEPHPVGTVMTKIVLGELLLWDIPTGLLVKSLREPLMVTHHVGMALTAMVGLYPLFSYYALFFYGVIEVSGIFLSFVDVFHPKHTAWCACLKHRPNPNPNPNPNPKPEPEPEPEPGAPTSRPRPHCARSTTRCASPSWPPTLACAPRSSRTSWRRRCCPTRTRCCSFPRPSAGACTRRCSASSPSSACSSRCCSATGGRFYTRRW